VEQPEGFRAILVEGGAQLGLRFTDEQLSQLELYHHNLMRWNQKTNLTALRETKTIAVKHFLDSLACSLALRARPATSTLLDVGSGAGFPGLPLKILYPDLQVTLLEPSHKKTAFLQQTIGMLDLKGVTTLHDRLETFSKQSAGRFTYITTRALAVRERLLLMASLLADDGRVILFRAQPIGSEFQPGLLKVAKEIAYTLPYGFGNRVLSVLRPGVPRGTVIPTAG
jgi:16S rRNA (guanine527-N7)-methyltransferase